MTIKKILNEQKMSMYQLSKSSQVPYSTIADLVNEKTKLMNSSLDVVLRISKALNLTLDDLVNRVSDPQMKRVPFERFKNAMRHQLHEMGDKAFLRQMLLEDAVEAYVSRQWYPEALYVLGMMDLLCRLNQIPLASKYESYRTMKLDRVLYPADIALLSIAQNDDRIKLESYEQSFPEFKRFNIVEGDIRNVI